jgi:hypothetical protein
MKDFIPQGNQLAFITSTVREALGEGPRGGGKTDAAVIDYWLGVEKYGPHWKGLLVRQTFPQLEDVIAKTHIWFHTLCPEAKYNKSTHTWHFPNGAFLKLRHIKSINDYYNFHGHEYTWICFEELTNWANSEIYTGLFSVLRTSEPGVPRKMRATTNPSGIGHNWVKKRFIDPMDRGQWLRTKEGFYRTAINLKLIDNKILLKANPHYQEELKASTKDPAKLKAWIYGDWNAVSGDAFGDVWDSDIHVINQFDIPKSWVKCMGFDWGSYKPYCASWFAISDGTPVKIKKIKNNVLIEGVLKNGVVVEEEKHFPKGSFICFDELYPDTNENVGSKEGVSAVAKKIMDKKHIVRFAVGDSAMWNETNRDDKTIGAIFEGKGVKMDKCKKSATSRVNDYAVYYNMLDAAKHNDLERPHLYFMSNCRNHIRTIPGLERNPLKPEDVATDGEDHPYDASRYVITYKHYSSSIKRGRAF